MSKPDWKELQSQFAAAHASTGIKLKDWCEQQGLVYDTARRYIKKSAQNNAQKKTAQRIAQNPDKAAPEQGKGRRKPVKNCAIPDPERSPFCAELSDKEKLFVSYYLECRNKYEAYRKAGYTGGDRNARILYRKPAVARAINQGIEQLSEQAILNAQDILRHWHEIAIADPGEISQMRRVCCRYCWGFDIKSIIAMADDTYPVTNAAAAAMWNFVSPSPSEINKVPPMAFRFLQAVNANKAKSSILTTMVKQNINYVDTGAEGGIANTMLVKGVTSDGNDMTYWYSVDWVQINVDMMLANAVINGSNNPINPLYYNQDGIDRLQQVAQGVFNTGVSYGLVNGQTPVNAVPFKTYVKNNPNDYGIGRYAGLSATYTPMRGFVEIVFNINVTMQLS